MKQALEAFKFSNISVDEYSELPVSFSWGNMSILVVVKGILSVCNQ